MSGVKEMYGWGRGKREFMSVCVNCGWEHDCMALTGVVRTSKGLQLAAYLVLWLQPYVWTGLL